MKKLFFLPALFVVMLFSSCTDSYDYYLVGTSTKTGQVIKVEVTDSSDFLAYPVSSIAVAEERITGWGVNHKVEFVLSTQLVDQDTLDFVRFNVTKHVTCKRD